MNFGWNFILELRFLKPPWLLEGGYGRDTGFYVWILDLYFFFFIFF